MIFFFTEMGPGSLDFMYGSGQDFFTRLSLPGPVVKDIRKFSDDADFCQSGFSWRGPVYKKIRVNIDLYTKALICFETLPILKIFDLFMF